MNTSTVEPIRATDLIITDDELTVTITDGRRLSVPLAWFPTLLQATMAQRNEWEWIGDGEGIHWPQLDEDLSIGGLFFGLRYNAPHRSVVRSGHIATFSLKKNPVTQEQEYILDEEIGSESGHHVLSDPDREAESSRHKKSS